MSSQTNLTSNIVDTAEKSDANLVNPWGLVVDPAQIWVANNGTNELQNYKLDGSVFNPAIAVTGTRPSGLVENKNPALFLINPTSPASLITVTEAGTIDAYNAGVSPASTTVMVTTPNAVFASV